MANISRVKVQGHTSTVSIRMKKGQVIRSINIFLFIILIIGLYAISASVQQKNNYLENENAEMRAEVGALEKQLVDTSSIDKIEDMAMKKYGMVHPSQSNYVKINVVNNDSGLREKIEKEAYRN